MSSPPSPTGERRALIFDLDSLNQRERWQAGWRPTAAAPDDPAGQLRALPRLDGRGRLHREGVQWFAGVLRTADVLTDRILVTDAQLLDGTFFQGLGVERVMHLLGRNDLDGPALTVVGRAASLEESLRQIAEASLQQVQTEHGSTTAFEYSVLAPLLRDDPEFYRRLHLIDAGRIGAAPSGAVAAGVAQVLQETHGTPASERYFRDLARSWQEWIEAERIGLVAFERFEGPRTDLWTAIQGRWKAPVETNRSEQWRELRATLGSTSGRSVARRILAEAVAARVLTAADRDELEQWWETLYMDLVAQSCRADWIDIMGGAQAVDRAPDSSAEGPRLARLRGDAPRLLGEMPPERYAVLQYEARGAVSTWRQERSQRACDRVAYAIHNAGEEVDLGSQRRELLLGLAISLGSAIVIFIVGLFGTLPGIAWIIPLAVLALTLGSELLKVLSPILELRRSALESVIHLDSGVEVRR